MTKDEIAKPIADLYGFPLDLVRASAHKRLEMGKCRKHIMWALRRELREDGRHRWSLQQIGTYMNVHHTVPVTAARDFAQHHGLTTKWRGGLDGQATEAQSEAA